MTKIEKLRRALTDANAAVIHDSDHWERVQTGQDSEEAEYSGYLAGYASGLEAALKILENPS